MKHLLSHEHYVFHNESKIENHNGGGDDLCVRTQKKTQMNMKSG